MGTRSRIGIERADGTVTSIYCHWDGYPSHNGRILVENYTTEAKINKLMKLGGLSSLDVEIGTKHDFDKKVDGECNAYGRDRGEKDVAAQTSANAGAMFFEATEGWEEYAYLYRGGCWYYSEVGGQCGPFMGRAVRAIRWRSVADAVARADAARVVREAKEAAERAAEVVA